MKLEVTQQQVGSDWLVKDKDSGQVLLIAYTWQLAEDARQMIENSWSEE